MKKQLMACCVLTFVMMLSGCATTAAQNSGDNDGSVVSQHNVENFGVGALVGIPIGLALTWIVLSA